MNRGDQDASRRRRIGLGLLLLVALLIAACSESTGDTAEGGQPDPGDTAVAVDDTGAGRATDAPADASADGDDEGEDDAEAGGDRDRAAADDAVVGSNVPVLDGGRIVPADLDGPTEELITIQEDPYVGAAVYPRPDYEANPWSQWGQGIALEDGRVITAIGDHLGPDANSYLFLYDPEARTITRFADVLSAVDHQPGSWGYGKIHSQMVDAGDGGIFFTTYYGTRRSLTFGGSYDGDVLFRLDKDTLDLQPVTVPTPGHGVPSLATNGRGLVYGEAVDPLLDDDAYPGGGFFVFDTGVGAVTRFDEDRRHQMFRNVAVGPDGTAWFAAEGNALFRYDPAADSVELTDIALPSPLRASTTPTDDGTVHAVTFEPFRFFTIGPDGEIDDLGQALAYTTSLALTPDQSSFLYVPGAHGHSADHDSPLIAVDTATGEQTTIVELLEPIQDRLGLVLGGTYSITIDRERGHAHIGFNAGETADSPWGEVVFVVVELP